MTYAEKLKDPRWQKKRLKILERDEWTCQLCGDDKTTLNVHHKKYTGEPYEAKDDDLITFCERCHEVTTKIGDIDLICYYRITKYGFSYVSRKSGTLYFGDKVDGIHNINFIVGKEALIEFTKAMNYITNG